LVQTEPVSKVRQFLREHGTRGINVIHKDKDGRSAMHLAVYNPDVEVIKCLVEHKGNLEACAARGQTPLMHAVAWDNRPLIDAMLALGANLHATCAPEFFTAPTNCFEFARDTTRKYLVDMAQRASTSNEVTSQKTQLSNFLPRFLFPSAH